MADKTYQSVAELIQDLINTGYDPEEYPEGYVNWQNFNASFFKGVEDRKPDFWKELLDYMKLNSPTLESDFDVREGIIPSVFYHINQNADLINSDIWDRITAAMHEYGVDLNNPSGVADNEGQTVTDYFWNETLSHLIATYVESFDDESGEITLRDGATIPISSIKNADAGYSFERDWVLPTYNIDGESYEEVRGADAIQSVLKNDDALQFTREQGANSWIRLLMPEYSRKVEVEDLDRNFWVISQVLSAVCAYLFGGNSVADLFEGVLKELVGLWQNCLYLWAAAAMISQENKKTDIHVEFAPLTNSMVYGYRKFDNFGETYTDVIDTIKERMDYLVQVYSNSHIIIIPELRSDNYKHNYYSKVEYPGMMVYNRNRGLMTWVNFVVDEEYRAGGDYLAIDLKQDFNAQSEDQLWVNKIGAITDDEIYYNYKQYFSSISSSETSPYYAAIRTRIPEFGITYNSGDDSFTISALSIHFYDAAAQAVGGQQYVICYFDQEQPITIVDETTVDLNLVYDDDEQTSGYEVDQTDVPITRGFYLGELVSCQSIIGLASYTMEASEYHGQQLYSANPEQIINILEES